MGHNQPEVDAPREIFDDIARFVPSYAGMVFLPFHLGEAPANNLTASAWDET